MPDINAVPTELPSTRQLIRSTIIAAVTAAVLLVTAVIPAEYGVDPTGLGRVLGLTEMGTIKVSLAKELEVEGAAAAHATSTQSTAEPSPPAATIVAPADAAPAPSLARSNLHETRVALRPGQGKEIKLVMREAARVKYSWSTDCGVVNYDMHADSVNPPRAYHGYAKGSSVRADSGDLVAAFDGSHGWFWRNRTNENVTVTLKTEGEYTELRELD